MALLVVGRSDGLISCTVCTCCIALGLLQSMQHPQIHLGRAVLPRHISLHTLPSSISIFQSCVLQRRLGQIWVGAFALLRTSGPVLRIMSSSLSLLLMSHCKWKMHPCFTIPLASERIPPAIIVSQAAADHQQFCAGRGLQSL